MRDVALREPGCPPDIMTGSSHKTFPGPQGGFRHCSPTRMMPPCAMTKMQAVAIRFRQQRGTSPRPMYIATRCHGPTSRFRRSRSHRHEFFLTTSITWPEKRSRWHTTRSGYPCRGLWCRLCSGHRHQRVQSVGSQRNQGNSAAEGFDVRPNWPKNVGLRDEEHRQPSGVDPPGTRGMAKRTQVPDEPQNSASGGS